MKLIIYALVISLLLVGCVRNTAKCKKDHQRVDKERKNGYLKNW